MPALWQSWENRDLCFWQELLVFRRRGICTAQKSGAVHYPKTAWAGLLQCCHTQNKAFCKPQKGCWWHRQISGTSDPHPLHRPCHILPGDVISILEHHTANSAAYLSFYSSLLVAEVCRQHLIFITKHQPDSCLSETETT